MRSPEQVDRAHTTARSRGVGAVVLCGGTSARFGGGDKTDQPLSDTTVLGALVRDLPAHWPVIAVGTPRQTPRPVTWAREDPPSSGPLAGIAAGVAALPEVCSVVVVLAGDQPFAGAAAVELVGALCDAPPEVDAVAARQSDGRPQLLLAAYRRDRLTPLLAAHVADEGVYRRLGRLHTTTLPVDHTVTLDVDTRVDYERARGALPHVYRPT